MSTYGVYSFFAGRRRSGVGIRWKIAKTLVCELPRRPGQRETRWMHLESAEGDPREMAEAAPPPPQAAPQAAGADTGAVGRRSPYDERLENLESTVEHHPAARPFGPVERPVW